MKPTICIIDRADISEFLAVCAYVNSSSECNRKLTFENFILHVTCALHITYYKYVSYCISHLYAILDIITYSMLHITYSTSAFRVTYFIFHLHSMLQTHFILRITCTYHVEYCIYISCYILHITYTFHVTCSTSHLLRIHFTFHIAYTFHISYCTSHLPFMLRIKHSIEITYVSSPGSVTVVERRQP